VDAASGAALEVGIGLEFPTLKKTSLVELELPTTLLLTVPPAIAAVVGMFKLDGWPFYLSAFAGVWLGFGSVFKVLQARAKDRKLAELRGPERLRGCLYVMHAAALWDTVPAEAHFQACLTAYHPFDDLIRTFIQQAQCAISFDEMPQPTAADFDLDAYKSADKATKWIEQQGSAAAGKAKSYAPVVVLGVGVVVVVLVAVRKSIVDVVA
jgi:hypothetical protein